MRTFLSFADYDHRLPGFLGVPLVVSRGVREGQVVTTGDPRRLVVGTMPHPWAVTEVRRLVEQRLGDVCAAYGISPGPRTAVEVLTGLGMSEDRAERLVAESRGTR